MWWRSGRPGTAPRGAAARTRCSRYNPRGRSREGVPMKAVRIHTPGGPDAMKYEDAPQPEPKAGEALVKVDAAGINYIDVYFRSGQYKATLPMTLGMEAGGTVTAIGSGVTEVKVGNKVAYTG